MKPKVRGPAETPSIVRTALIVNVLLLLVALVSPRLLAGSEAAPLLFAVPMALIVAIGAAAAIRAFILARREDRPIRWTAFLPVSMFLVGMVGTLLLVYAKFV